MDIITIVLDRRPAYLQEAPAAVSLLTLPVGTGTVLGELLRSLPESASKRVRILPTFEPCAQYARTVLDQAPPGSRLVGPDALSVLANEHEPSDVVLTLDPKYWPVDGIDLSPVTRRPAGLRWAVHGVAVGTPGASTREFVHCDEAGRIRRISRYYDRVTNLTIDAIAYSVVPLASCEGITLDSLADFRAGLSARGVLSRDVPLETEVLDLAEEHGLLALNEQRAISATSGDAPPGYRLNEAGLLVEGSCQVHAESRIVGPVVLQKGVTVDRGAVILGPAVVGRDCRIERDAMLAQAVVAAQSTVSPQVTIRQQLGAGHCNGNGSARTDNNGRGGNGAEPLYTEGICVGANAPALGGLKIRGSLYPTVKLVLDVALAFVALVVLSPLIALTALAIKIESRGPVFFGHEREGKGGKLFRCLKFRTMSRDAHLSQRDLYANNALDGPQFKIHNDPRVTRVGKWLRATNIDELPQLINVLLGQMSLVGPRPSPFRENQICVPWRRARLSVRPGITGLWQICRDQRAEGDFHQWIAYDIMYVRHTSLGLDLKILLATVWTLGGLWNVPSRWLVGDERTASRASRRRSSGALVRASKMARRTAASL